MNSHNPGSQPGALPIELRPQRRRLESNQHQGTLQVPASPLGLVVNPLWWGGHSCPPSFETARRAGIEPATSRFGAEYSSTEELPARRYAYPKMRREGLEPPQAMRPSVLQTDAIAALPPTRFSKSAWKDLNLRPRAPEARALPNCATR